MDKLIMTLTTKQQREIRRKLRKPLLKEIVANPSFLPMYLNDAMKGTLKEISDLIDVSAYV